MENPHAPQKDEALVVTYYKRTPQQAAMLGLEVMWSCVPFLLSLALSVAGGVVSAFLPCKAS